MAEPSKGGIKKNGQVRGGTASGRKYVKTDRPGSKAQTEAARKETNSRGDKPRVKANSGRGGAVAVRDTPKTPSGGKGAVAVRGSSAVGGMEGKPLPRNPGTVQRAGASATPDTQRGYSYSSGQPAEGMKDVGSGRSAGAANPRSYSTSAQTSPGARPALPAPSTPDMSAGSRNPMSGSTPPLSPLANRIANILGRFSGPVGAAAMVLEPSETNAGEREWIEAGRPAQGMPQPPQGGAQAAPQQQAVAPPQQLAPQSSPNPRVSVAPPSDTMPQRSAPARPTAQPSRPTPPPAKAPMSKPSGLSVDEKVAQLVQRGFSRDDAMKLATAQGGKVNAPAGYAKGGMVKAPGMARMPRMPATGKAGTTAKVKAMTVKPVKVPKPKKVK